MDKSGIIPRTNPAHESFPSPEIPYIPVLGDLFFKVRVPLIMHELQRSGHWCLKSPAPLPCLGLSVANFQSRLGAYGDQSPFGHPPSPGFTCFWKFSSHKGSPVWFWSSVSGMLGRKKNITTESVSVTPIIQEILGGLEEVCQNPTTSSIFLTMSRYHHCLIIIKAYN